MTKNGNECKNAQDSLVAATFEKANVTFLEGTLIENSGSGTSIFKPKELSIWKGMFGVGAREVPAYGCIHCQHLQIAVSFIGDDLQRYQQFEDEQPVC